jgi:hypothetical protein
MMNTRLERPAPFTRAFRETEGLPSLPVDERTNEMRTIYSAKVHKLILGQKHSGNNSKPGSRSHSRPGTAASEAAKRNLVVGKGVSAPGSKVERGPTSGLTFVDSIDTSVSMLSIGSIVDDFRRLMFSNQSSSQGGAVMAPGATEQEDTNKGEPDVRMGEVHGSDVFSPPQNTNISLSPIRRPRTPAAWAHPQLFCRYPNCKQLFKNAFDLFNHTKSAHTEKRNFHQSVVPVRSSDSYRLASGDIDPRPRSPPKRANCSGLLPEVPRTKQPSPDKNGLVWPVEVLQQQNKFQESFLMADFRAHSAKLREYNNAITQDVKEKQWALNKSPGKPLKSNVAGLPSSPISAATTLTSGENGVN